MKYLQVKYKNLHVIQYKLMIDLLITSTEQKQIIDITNEINDLIKDKGIINGVCSVFVQHTTCSLTIAELDPGTDIDFLKAIEKMFPGGKYLHPHNPGHVGDHIMSSIIGNSVIVPVEQGRVSLGTWQSIVLIELNGPRNRSLKVHFGQ
jgi:secondary thiamine-phosphate synthase enzyme